jgi:flagellar biosynthesis anti-sigma factor FlgM
MKIDRDTPNLPPLKNDAVDSSAVDANPTRVAGSDPAPSGDQLKLSPDLAIARDAIKLAAALPDIRQDRVDQVRKLLEQGDVGRDPERLADAIISSLIDQPVDTQE